MTRKLKKIAALVLAAAMLVSCFALNGFAIGTATGDEAMKVDLALSAETAAPGDVITVTVSISNNYNATTMRWPVLYSTDVFELVGEDGNIATPIDSVTTFKGNTEISTNDEFIPAGYSEGYSAFAIQWIAENDGTTVGAFNSATTVDCFTFQLKVLDTASGKGTVLIPENSDKFYKMAINDVNDGRSYYQAPVAITVGQAATCTIEGAAAPVAPTLVPLGDTIIDEERGFIYGLVHADLGGVADLVADGCVEVEGDGEVVCTPVDGNDLLGTGATVELKDSTGATVETYTVIIFGDSNGDATISPDDTADAELWYAYLESEIEDYEDMTDPRVFALDITADEAIGTDDFEIVDFYYAYIYDDVPQTYEGF